MTLGMGLSVDAQEQYGVTVTDDATVGCDLDPQLQVFTSGPAGPATPGCDNWRGLWPFVVAGQRPQVVALGLGRWEVADHLLDGHWVHIGEPAWNAAPDGRSAVRHHHSPLVWCQSGALHHALRRPQRPARPTASPGRRTRRPGRRPTTHWCARWRPAHPGVVSVIDLNRMLSPAGVYTASVSGIDVRSTDGIHVSLDGGELLQRQILPAVDRIGMEDEAAKAQT